MFARLLAPVLTVSAVFLTAMPVMAQPGSPICGQLESQLAALNQQGGRGDPRLEQSYSRARQDLDRSVARSRGIGCDRTSIFGPRPPAECGSLEDRIDSLKRTVDQLANAVRRSRSQGEDDGRRQDVMAALAQNGCGRQYQAAAPQQQQQQRRQGGLFGLLFGNRNSQPQEEAPPPDIQTEAPRTSTFRTVCVRTCDGFFFPVSFAADRSRFEADENMCRRTCPGTEAQLFAYPNPGGTMEQATSIMGQPYKDLPNAFKYQTTLVKDCSCKPAGQSWAQALSGAEDATVQNGDIVVDEERSRAMSQPKGSNRATPSEAARAVQDSAGSVTSEGVDENPDGVTPVEPDVRTAVPVYGPPPTSAPAPVYAPPY